MTTERQDKSTTLTPARALVAHYEDHLQGVHWEADQNDWKSPKPEKVNCITLVLNLGYHALNWDLSDSCFQGVFASQLEVLPKFFKDVSPEVGGAALPGDVFWWRSLRQAEESAAHVGICIGANDEMVHAQPRAGGVVVKCHCEAHGSDLYRRGPTKVYRWVGPNQNHDRR